jgi:hypothetical protein
MNLDIKNLTGILYFLAPFIIVCYFLFFSIINVDLRGIIYLIGLFTGTILTVFICNGLVGQNRLDSQSNLCNIVSINNIVGISNVPISLTIYCFTAAYIIYTAVKYSYVYQIFGAIMFFGILILGDMYWLFSNNCFRTENILSAFVVSSIVGVSWGYLIDKFPNKSLQYFAGNDTACTVPKRRTFKCKRGATPDTSSNQFNQIRMFG